ncbi:MAG: RdgB/HAM1 family non-canonical purine NTP pyrophosphatase [Xanthomonadales bacterium]|nr:RdgB/HAM1 family non-canonical purine NTP pyrophosphatase [Xanthomonadales bacterium]
MTATTRVVVATGNAGKLAELRELLADTGMELVAQTELGIDEVEETGASFVENALIKARHASRQSGLPALADDSGLLVTALAGAPGLHSARYAGVGAGATANIEKLLAALAQRPDAGRDACFYACLVLLRHADDPLPVIAEGLWRGSILESPLGAGGFGYDPVFLDPGQGLSAAQMAPALKSRISHRARAVTELRRRLSDPQTPPLG